MSDLPMCTAVGQSFLTVLKNSLLRPRARLTYRTSTIFFVAAKSWDHMRTK